MRASCPWVGIALMLRPSEAACSLWPIFRELNRVARMVCAAAIALCLRGSARHWGPAHAHHNPVVLPGMCAAVCVAGIRRLIMLDARGREFSTFWRTSPQVSQNADRLLMLTI